MGSCLVSTNVRLALKSDKRSSLFCPEVRDWEKKFYSIDPTKIPKVVRENIWAQSFKTFYIRNLQMLVISLV
jgi:hypothetical protein